MPTENDNYENGRSGFGAPNYSSPGWMAGDLERRRLQREKTQYQQQLDREFFLANNTNTKANSYVQSQYNGEGCFTVLFSISRYLIVFYALSKLIYFAINTLSSSYAFNIPEWFPIAVILIVFGLVLFYKKYISRIVILSIATLIGNSLLFRDEGIKQTVSQKKTAQLKNTLRPPKNIQELRERLNDNVKLVHIPPSKAAMNCRPCALILGKNSNASSEVKKTQYKICEKYRLECSNTKNPRYIW